jgi:Family of unknown function (DUF5329)
LASPCIRLNADVPTLRPIGFNQPGTHGIAAVQRRLSRSTAPMRRPLLLLLTCAFVSASVAAPVAPAARAEIDGLLSRLEASGCEFYRNGSRHAAAEATPHLLGKLKYLEDRGAVQTAEQFIDLAASRSSVTGQAYLIKCGSAAPVESGAWLRSQLKLIRSASPAALGPK